MKCRICLHTESSDTMVSPCGCKGSMKWVHLDCLTRSRFIEGHENKCAVCSVEYKNIPMQFDPDFGLTWTQTYIAEILVGLVLSAVGSTWAYSGPTEDGILIWVFVTSAIYLFVAAVFFVLPIGLVVLLHRCWTSLTQ